MGCSPDYVYHLYNTVPGFIDLSQTTCLTAHDDHILFQVLHVERLEHYGSLVSASSVSVRSGVFYQDDQAIVLSHPRTCAVVSHHLMVYNIRYLKGPISGQTSWMGISRSFSPLQRPTKALIVCWEMARSTLGDGEVHDITINSSNIDCLPPCPVAYAR